MWELILDNIARAGVPLSEAESGVLQSLFTHKKYRRNQYLLQQGEVARYETFVLKGLTRTYELDDKGQEHVLFFGPEDWWVGDLYSFLSGAPATCNIDCLEDTEVLQISKGSLDRLYAEVPQMNLYFRLKLQNAFIALSRRISSSLSKPAVQRYQEFLEQYPRLEQRIPNHQIASFLGITPQSLSRLRSRH
ncbi:Crp/Fnr family transcriptional regulator [Paraflavisolibacter sp. H34]|uniref:Crp/Fnr family transcriptional regulator n=1 Tax=Huijunlia imazamoxiresistens TaxID=3127457 RepID=UPI0030163620